MKANVIGAGLAGAEAAYQLANRGIKVTVYEQKPVQMSEAHSYTGYGELVCSNSLRSDRLSNAAGLLKEEMRRLDSLIIKAAENSRVPAGGALAVERYAFSDYITKTLKAHENIEIVEKEVTDFRELDGLSIVATGPLTSPKLTAAIQALLGEDYFHFFDAAAPIVTAESVDMTRVFWGSRYDRGNDYLNCPMTKEEYDAFYQALITAECVEMHGFEAENVFEGCMPVEVMAKRGYDTLRFGPLKPVGFENEEKEMPYALVQLRKEDREGRLFNLVGFQTHLKFGEQKRVFSMIPGLENAEYVRLGVMHKNTYINGPKCLCNTYQLKKNADVYFAGQITGVEGYIESAASGLYAGIMAAHQLQGKKAPRLSRKTAIGALAEYVSNAATTNYQPMNITFGIMEEADKRFRKRLHRREYIAKRALAEIDAYQAQLEYGKEMT